MNSVSIIVVTWFISLLCAFGVGWFSHFLTARRESNARLRKAKDEFHAVIARQRGQLNAVNGFKWDTFFKEAIPPLSEAVWKLKPFLPDKEWNSLYELWNRYYAQKDDEFKNVEWTAGTMIETGIAPKARLEKFLDDFDCCIK